MSRWPHDMIPKIWTMFSPITMRKDHGLKIILVVLLWSGLREPYSVQNSYQAYLPPFVQPDGHLLALLPRRPCMGKTPVLLCPVSDMDFQLSFPRTDKSQNQIKCVNKLPCLTLQSIFQEAHVTVYSRSKCMLCTTSNRAYWKPRSTTSDKSEALGNRAVISSSHRFLLSLWRGQRWFPSIAVQVKGPWKQHDNVHIKQLPHLNNTSWEVQRPHSCKCSIHAAYVIYCSTSVQRIVLQTMWL